MPQNLFSRLLKYRPTDALTPKENFLTEAFATVLENDPEFAREIKKQIMADLHLSGNSDEGISDVQTQVYVAPDLRIDMVVWLSKELDSRVGIEIKWGSEQREEQLSDYKKHLNNLLYLTELGANRPNINVPHWTWNRICSVMETLNKSRDMKPWISTQFFNWLKEAGMADQNFNLMDLAIIPNFFKVENKITNCIQLFQSELPKLMDWKKLGFYWTGPTLNKRCCRWQNKLELNGAIQLNLIAAIGEYEEENVMAAIWIECDPRWTKHRKAIRDFLSDSISDPHDFKVVHEKDNWILLNAEKPIVNFFKACNEIPFDDIVSWWIDQLKVILKHDVIKGLQEICTKIET